jgi:hypothetical protein
VEREAVKMGCKRREEALVGVRDSMISQWIGEQRKSQEWV